MTPPPDRSSRADDWQDPTPPPPDPHLDLADLVREFSSHPVPAPAEADWDRVRGAIETRLMPATPARRWRPRVAAALTALAASVLAGTLLWPEAGPWPAVVEPAADPLAEYAVLPIATPDDVMVSAVRNGDRVGFVACDHPLPGVMPLAGADDLAVSRATAGELSLPTPDDAPVFVDNLDK